MEAYNSHYIFQEKISELFEGLDKVSGYIEYVRIITKENVSKDLKELEKFLQKLAYVGSKINTEGSLFRGTELISLDSGLARTASNKTIYAYGFISSIFTSNLLF